MPIQNQTEVLRECHHKELEEFPYSSSKKERDEQLERTLRGIT